MRDESADRGAAPSPQEGLLQPQACPLCGLTDWVYLFPMHDQRVLRCGHCRLTRLDGQPRDRPVRALHPDASDPWRTSPHRTGSRTEHEAAESYCDALEQRGLRNGKLLVLAPPEHPVFAVAARRGHSVTKCTEWGGLPDTDLTSGPYDAAALIFQIETAPDPVSAITLIRANLRTRGILMVVTPSLDSPSARMLRGSWTEWRSENLYYFDSQTVQSLLLRCGMSEIQVRRDVRRYSLEHLYQRARAFPQTWVTRSIRASYHLVPPLFGRNVRIPLPASAIVVTARRSAFAHVPMLSIVMPVYNERKTLQATLDAVLAKQLPGVRKEIIVVESASTDGSREIALAYKDHPDVKLVLQEVARGKGNAVREGFKHASGDFILIQDADQEYDVDDYDALVNALQTYRAAFVLGSRHTDGWKIRRFNDQPGVATLFNIGHLVFLGLFNLLYRQRLRDPFTMFKVFRRDCLHDLEFECDRFDFDFELVIKLLRKGYQPIELPVNYRARSFQEGKKVSAFRDPVTWLRALFKYRFQSLAPRSRRARQ